MISQGMPFLKCLRKQYHWTINPTYVLKHSRWTKVILHQKVAISGGISFKSRVIKIVYHCITHTYSNVSNVRNVILGKN